jgi:hypothetical protein
MTPDQLEKLIEPQLPEGPIVLTAGPLLGLGDTAIYSTLPERFSKLGYDVYLDKDTRSSNPEIYELFWQKNPYIKGLTDKKPNAGYPRQGLFYEIANRLPGYRSIEAMERAHALPPPYGMAPKVYYEPKPFHVKLDNIILVDFSAVSSKIGQRGLAECMKMMSGKFKNPHYLQVLHQKHIVLNSPIVVGSQHHVASIYEYLDMLASCRGWIGSEAGGQSLASAIRGEHSVYDESINPEIVCTITPQTFNSRGYTYANVDYRVTSDTDTTRDYWSPHEIETHKYEIVCKVRLHEMEERLAAR